ncbi:MAG: zinc ribbon domain-containing protein [Promethearchaeota archaeon]
MYFRRNLRQKCRIIIIITFILGAFVCIRSLLNPVLQSENDQNFKNLKNSSQEINITSPENITYYKPMSGFFPATYGFENDEVGTIPEEWDDYKEDSLMINEIINELDGHKKVIHMDKGDTFGINNNLCQNFSSVQQYGTIEFWARTTDVNQESSWHMKSGTFNQYSIAGIRIMESNFQIKNTTTTWYPVSYTAYNNHWYHIKIQFECGTGNHYGLTQYNWRLFINNNQFGDFNMISSQSNVSHFLIHQNWRYYNFEMYTDAIGYSWDPNYNVGDNMDEGLLLSFEQKTALDWIGYSLDEQSNKTIIGNTTLPMPSNGYHNVQIFGNNTIGELFESGKTHFSVEYVTINLLTPENTTYTEPMRGYYPATYGFENDKDGTIPQEWNYRLTIPPQDSYIKVISSLDGHNKVVDLNKGDTFGNHLHFYHYFSAQTHGTIEFWLRTTDVNEGSVFSIMEGNTTAGGISIGADFFDSYFSIYTIGGWQSISHSAVNDKWYHISFQFECGTGNHYGLDQNYFKVYIDGIKYGDYKFSNVVPNVNRSYFLQNWRYDNYHTYIDAIGYSWDPNYDIGNNLNEGLLLTFTNSSTLDWIGYSLNNQVNQTIIGNQVIPMPEKGFYKIQIHGISTSGHYYSSNLVYFTIDTREKSQNGVNNIFILIFIVFGIFSLVGLIMVIVVYKKVHTSLREPIHLKPKVKKIKPEKRGIIEEELFCPFCNAPITYQQKFCKYCGSNLKKGEEPDI